MIGSAVGAAVGIGGALIGGSSANKAAKAQSKAADAAAAAQLEAARISANTALGIYGSTKASLLPYTQTGTAALNQLAMMYGLPVYSTPTDASQVPIIPGLNDGSQYASGGSSGAFPGGGTGGYGSPYGSPGPGFTLTPPSAAAQIEYLRNNTVAKHGPNKSVAEINAYLAANPNLTPEQQLAGIQSIVAQHPKLQAAYGDWLQNSGTWTPPATTGTGTGGTTPPGNGTPTAPNFTAMLEALTQTPGYQFGREQGQQALERSAAARGLTLSGAQLQDAQKFGTDYAIAAGWNPYVSQLNAFAGLGENAAAGTGNAGTAAAGQVGSAITTGAANASSAQLAGAQARASGILAQGNMWQDILGGIGSFF